ncbi:MAG TPA: molybdate ABC transporter substrate-binding protein [Enterovirga sp.]
MNKTSMVRTGVTRRGVSGLAGGAWLALARPAAASDAVLVFAAASLKTALDEIVAAWTVLTGKRATVSYAASNTLAKQIEAGAPADLFISADLAWMDHVAAQGLIRPETRINLLGNTLVLIAPRDEAKPAEIGPSLTDRLGGGRLAMANVEAVPAGRYGRLALEKLGAWTAIRDRIAQAESVRAALLLVSRGEAPLGLVYRTDAAADPTVAIVATFPPDSHPPIVYPAALTKTSAHPEAAALLAFLRSGTARGIFEKQGFAMLGKLGSGS